MIYQIFSNNIELNYDAAAIVTSDGNTFTYSMVHRRVNQWANYLIKQGIEAGDRVAVLLDDEDHHVFILLALDRINAIYVPFDTDIPTRQLTHDIETLSLKKFIIETSLTADFDIPSDIKLCFSTTEFARIASEDANEPTRPYDINASEKIIYIVSSSGSTGNKKWIPILGMGLLYWAEVEKKLFEPYPIDKVLATRSPAYDARISEYVRTFSAGGELHLLTRIQRKDFSSILSACEKKSISCLLLIASQLGGEQAKEIIANLKSYGVKHLMVTGDACTPYLKELCEGYGIYLWNCYGPTEATFGLSILLVNDIVAQNSLNQPIVPIGKPYGSDVHFHIKEGVLHIESPYLTPGYLNIEDNETAFKLLDLGNGKKTRVFDTGDKFDEKDGFLFFEGRASFDGHCKIDGVKVNPHMIEQCINDYNKHITGGSIQAAVVVKEHLGRDKLFAYLVIPENFDKPAFLAYLKANLKKEERPIPICIDKFPELLPSQKIDRKQLIARKDNPEESFFSEGKSEKQSSAIGQQDVNCHLAIQKIWQDILQQDTIPFDVDFIFLGGDSRMAKEMVERINQQFKNEYSYQMFLGLATQTVNSLADSIINKKVQDDERAFIQPLIPVEAGQGNIFFLPALLGEGFFSYRHLARRMAKKFPGKNIYGLSDPGITDERLMPESMEHAVRRYIHAMKSIQPSGPYTILGFSFGATLAYEVAKQLHLQGERVAEIYLVDGFPAYLYQALSNQDHADLLQELLNFIVATLNNRYYGEKLKPIVLRNFSKLDKQQQITLGFDHFIKKSVNPASINLLNLAKRHLTFLLAAAKPQDKLPFWPTFYLTNREQQYLQVINKIPGLSKRSSDYHYFFWTRYFCNITRCGIELEGGHLSILKAGPSEDKRTPDSFWVRAHDPLFNIKVDHYGPNATYRLAPFDAHYQLTIFFLSRISIHSVYKELLKMGLTPKVSFHDKYLKKYEQGDLIYTSQANLRCLVPAEKLTQVKLYIEKIGMEDSSPEKIKKLPLPKGAESPGHASGSIDLIVLWNSGHFVTLSFKYHTLPKMIIGSLHQYLQLLPIDFSDEGHLVYHHGFVLVGASIYDAMRSVQGFLADFISVIQEYIGEDIPQAGITNKM